MKTATQSIFLALSILLTCALGLSLTQGSVSISAEDLWQILQHWFVGKHITDELTSSALIVEYIRIPRTLLGLGIGAVLAITGVCMQALFRNPLADPGLIGVSAGAALGAALAIALGGYWSFSDQAPDSLIFGSAFAGGLLVTWLAVWVGHQRGRLEITTLLLAGVAFTALAGALIGLLTYLADDSTLRRLTFWNLGTLEGATYPRIWPLLLVAGAIALWLPFRAQALNALLLGEAEAYHLGVPVERLKHELIVCTALGVGASVAAAGLIGFIGLVVPHIMRLLVGPDHRILIPATLLAGPCLLLLSDVIARLALAPAELPIGIVTAALGAPFFVYVLLKGRY